MAFALTFLLFSTVMLTMTAVGYRLFLRPQTRLKRLSSTLNPTAGNAPARREQGLPALLKDLGKLLPVRPRQMQPVERLLVRAGYRDSEASQWYHGARVSASVALATVACIVSARVDAGLGQGLLITCAGLLAGWRLPGLLLKRRATARQRRLRRALPDALDLLVICVESGLGLDQALTQIAKELSRPHREISEELTLVNLELRAGKRRNEALRQFGERTDVEEIKKLVTVLIQADRFGSSIALSLRSHSDFTRVQSRQAAEEAASKLGVKLVFPIFFCILPSLFVVTVGPMAVRIVRDVLPMIEGI